MAGVTTPAVARRAPALPAPLDLTRADGPAVDARPKRLVSLDVLRGLAIVLMLLVDNPGIPAAQPAQLVHPAWHGFRVADLVFPLFLFAVGVAMPFSRKAASPRLAGRRVVFLFAIGTLLNSVKYGRVTFAGVLQHIAGSYLIAWCVLRLRIRWQLAIIATILGGAWAAYTFLDAPGIDPGSWAYGRNPGAVVDSWLFGGPQTEGVPAMVFGAVNVIFGVVVGRLMKRAPTHREVLARLAGWGVGAVALGVALAFPVPVNKHLWTPSYAVLTSGLSCLVLLALYELVDRRGLHGWSRPLVQLGMNALAVFVFSQAVTVLVLTRFRSALVAPLAHLVTAPVASVLYGVGVCAMSWLLAWVLYRREVFVRV